MLLCSICRAATFFSEFQRTWESTNGFTSTKPLTMTPEQIDLFTPRLLQVQHSASKMRSTWDQGSHLVPALAGSLRKHVRRGTETFVWIQQHVWLLVFWKSNEGRVAFINYPHIRLELELTFFEAQLSFRWGSAWKANCRCWPICCTGMGTNRGIKGLENPRIHLLNKHLSMHQSAG